MSPTEHSWAKFAKTHSFLQEVYLNILCENLFIHLKQWVKISMLFFNFIHLIRELFNIQKNIGKKYGGIKQLMKYSQKKREVRIMIHKHSETQTNDLPWGKIFTGTNAYHERY